MATPPPGGDGPKRILLEEVREKHCLEERVTMLGMVPHAQVKEVREGHERGVEAEG